MFSVILPAYNSARFLNQAVESVFRQREKGWELIVVDDGSTDDAQAVLEAYRDHPQVRVIRQENQGAAAARNRGMAEARGDYFAFLDADDLWHENHLEVMAELIRHYPQAGLYGSFTSVQLANRKTASVCPYFQNRPETVLLEDFFEEYGRDKSAKVFTIITTCVSRKAWEKVGGFPVGCKIGEDLEFSLRVAAYFPVALTGKATALYRKTLSQATKDDSFDPDWVFFQGVEELYQDASIPQVKNEHLREVMEWFSIRRCRHYLIQGKKASARAHLAEMGHSKALRKDRAATYLLLLLPTNLVRTLFQLRWKGKS